MPIIEDNDLDYFVCGGPQIDPSTYKTIIGEPEHQLSKEEENGIQSTSNR